MPYNSKIFQFKTEKCAYLGSSPIHKGHKCLTSAGRIYISRHVQFNENEFPFAAGFGLTNDPLSTPSTHIGHSFHKWFSTEPISQPNSISTCQPNDKPNLGPSSMYHLVPQPLDNVLLPSSTATPNVPNLTLLSPISPCQSSFSHPQTALSPSSPYSVESFTSSHHSDPILVTSAPPSHPIITRAKDGIFKPKVWLSVSPVD